ncbi:MAG: putative membrane protein [Marinobacter maritimus]|jgi:uncharacterized membrane protein|uniref:hypothetical protein n=1 Tax=Marinobacter maritimus TaxID=277961 RepID=UPI001642C7B3|nr:hypothetical protein [Marinobacter maritimus]MBL1271387.1 hypothetical protein [Oceanospirillales bacterium]|tara:strand:+ start:693 stop:866 length:174 start_codon:yes stop_codon:yes gene_type:complete
MGGKPDIIRAIVLIFAVGLVITGFTSLQASEDKPSAAVVKSSVAADSVQMTKSPLAR